MLGMSILSLNFIFHKVIIGNLRFVTFSRKTGYITGKGDLEQNIFEQSFFLACTACPAKHQKFFLMSIMIILSLF